MPMDVLWLVVSGNMREAWQVNHCQLLHFKQCLSVIGITSIYRVTVSVSSHSWMNWVIPGPQHYGFPGE